VADELTIEQVAAQSGMTVRNIRAHQARGLLAPPQVRLRVGYYGPEHVTQLKLIRDLQADGFNLAGIKRLLDDTSAAAERLARFRAALTQARNAERSQTVTVADLGRRFHVAPDEAAGVLARAERLGVLVRVGDKTYQAPSPSLLEVAEQVVARGISLDAALAVFEDTEEHCDAVATSFVKLFIREVWDPFHHGGMPFERWSEIETSIERLRELATRALLAIFGRHMSAQIESAFGELLQQLSDAGRV
jgi:DNA-binding transcriptional MerR regulator